MKTTYMNSLNEKMDFDECLINIKLSFQSHRFCCMISSKLIQNVCTKTNDFEGKNPKLEFTAL